MQVLLTNTFLFLINSGSDILFGRHLWHFFPKEMNAELYESLHSNVGSLLLYVWIIVRRGASSL